MAYKDIPVFLVTGFLESGKTSFVSETFETQDFNDGEKTLYIVCEEGIEECDEEILNMCKVTTVVIENEEDFNSKNLEKLVKENKPDRVMIEYNGTWDLKKTIDGTMPKFMQLAAVVTTIDSNTFEVYLNNMKQMMTNQYKMSDMVIMNRCAEDAPKAKFKRMIRAVNARAQVIFENNDGEVDENFKDELPYDIDKDIIEVEDIDFGILYLDMLDKPENYVGKKVSFNGQVYYNKSFQKGTFVPGRFGMTCCAEDITFVGFICYYDKAQELECESYVHVVATVDIEKRPEYDGEGPVLHAVSISKASAPKDDLVYFNA